MPQRYRFLIAVLAALASLAPAFANSRIKPPQANVRKTKKIKPSKAQKIRPYKAPKINRKSNKVR